MVQQVVLLGSLLVTSAMQIQIHAEVATEIAGSVVIYGISGAILFISVSEIANLIRMARARRRKKRLAQVDIINNQ